jgi:hypothetical protein
MKLTTHLPVYESMELYLQFPILRVHDMVLSQVSGTILHYSEDGGS